jgi:hypothetical protein
MSIANEKRWVYARNGQQQATISESELRQRISRGDILPTDLLWSEGMPQWKPLHDLPELSPSASTDAANPKAIPLANTAPASPASSQSYPTPSDQAVGYFRTGGNLPPHAHAVMAKYPPPLGDVNHWPCNDRDVADFDQAVKYRKRIMAAAKLYKGLFALTLIATIIVVISVGAAAAVSTRGGAGATFAMLFFVGIALGFCVLYWFAWRATERLARWAPLTVGILLILAFLLQAGSVAAAGMVAPTAATSTADFMLGMTVSTVVSALFTFAFCWTSFRAYGAIPPYRALPAWAQELTIRAKL